ncbi:DNA polymerase IV [Candidatus Daviesbacteria bacterium]|nr:DNA polymerase IV [Candidatus Daviesbacteria bacterium]
MEFGDSRGRVIFHIDFNSYFATVEQQANPRLRGKPIGVTGGDRMKRTVIGAASQEAKEFGVKTGMQIWEAKELCPQIILIKGDCDKYLETTKRFLNILKDYSPNLEIFSIDEVFLELPSVHLRGVASFLELAQQIKSRIRTEVGEYITCSIGISYNKLMAKLAGSLYKPDGLVMIADTDAARFILDRVGLDEICGIGDRLKKRLNNMGVFNFAQLRSVPLKALIASFKPHQGLMLYNISRGIADSIVTPFFTKEEVKSIGHRHTISHDTDDLLEIKQILLKICEMVGKRLRDKKLVGKTVSCWYREALNPTSHRIPTSEVGFNGDGMQATIFPTQDGLEIFKAGLRIFQQIWNGNKIRMIGVSISNLKEVTGQTISLLPEVQKQETIIKTLDRINNKYGDFTLQRGILLTSVKIKRKPNPFLTDRRFRM